MGTEEERYEDILHECKSCGGKRTVRMSLSSGLPAYTGSDTHLCSKCDSGNTIMFSGKEQVEP